VRPEKSARVGSIRSPAFGACGQLGRRRSLRPAERRLRAAQQADIRGREDIGPPKVVQEKHLRRPRPDAAHLLELGLGGGVVASGEPAERQTAVDDALGEVAEGPCLCA